jgi:hypothetical protein
METNRQALYLFCLARPDLVGAIEGSGIDDGQALFVIPCAPDLCAIVCELPQEEFCGPAAERRMRQLAWVAPRALRHEAVVEMVMRRSPVLPARFGTLFSSPERLAEFLAAHRKTISQFLGRVVDHEEWSVKGRLDRKRATLALISERLAAQQAQLAALPPGTRYFQELRTRSAAEKELSLWLDEICRQVASDLAKQACDVRECPVGSREAPESDAEVVLNWAYLLPHSGTSAFRARIDQLNVNHASQGLVWEMSGPWPPYRFVPSLSMGTSP